MEFDLKKTLEALLLSTVEPIDCNELKNIFARHRSQLIETAKDDEPSSEELEATYPKLDMKQINAALEELTSDAEVKNKTYRIVEGPNGFQMVTAPQFAEYVRLLRGEPRPMKLSPAALETLSIIAYRQPVTRAEIEAIRGVSVDGPLNRLIEFEMAHVTGKADLPGRPIQYGTTDRFLEFIGIKDLNDLPASDVLSNQQINDWVQRDSGHAVTSDKDVGLAEEAKQGILKFAKDNGGDEAEWQLENIESDTALNT